MLPRWDTSKESGRTSSHWFGDEFATGWDPSSSSMVHPMTVFDEWYDEFASLFAAVHFYTSTYESETVLSKWCCGRALRKWDLALFAGGRSVCSCAAK